MQPSNLSDTITFNEFFLGSLTFTSLQEPEPSDDPIETDSIDLRLSTLETLRDKLRRINMAARSLAASQNSATQDTPSDPEPSHVRAGASGAQNPASASAPPG